MKTGRNSWSENCTALSVGSIFGELNKVKRQNWAAAVNSATNARKLGNNSCSNVNNNGSGNTNDNLGFRAVVRPLGSIIL